MKVPLLDLQAQYQSIKAEVLSRLQPILESQRFILGPEVEDCERKVAGYCGTPYGCGVSSGTDALLIALMNEGIGAGDEVITPAYTFFATCGSIVRTGAVPVLVDIDPVTYNLKVDAVRAAVTSRTRAIMPVHLFGQTADMDPILEIAKKHGLIVIEDAAQAIGAEYKEKRAGSFGKYGCFSFFPSKNLGCFGDGGLVVSSDEKVDHGLKILRNHGMDPKYYYKRIGGNFRLDALQAAVISVKIDYLDQWTKARQRNAEHYGKLFREAGLEGLVGLPKVVHSRHVFNQYVIRIPGRRDELIKHLQQNEIGCEIYYPLPMHLQECFRDLKYKEGDFPESEKASLETLAIPVYPELGTDQQEYVVNTIRKFLLGK